MAQTTINLNSNLYPTIGRIVHANVAPGRIQSISIPGRELGVEGFGRHSLTGKQTLDNKPYYGPIVSDQPILAIDRVRYRGEPIAVIAELQKQPVGNDSTEIAVETTPVTAIATGAGRSDSPLVHVIDLLERSPLASGIAFETTRSNRLRSVIQSGRASDQVAMRGKRVEISRALSNPELQLFSAAQWSEGRLSIATNSSDGDEICRELGLIFGLDETSIRVEASGTAHSGLPSAIGLEAIAAAIARSANRRVALSATRSDFGWSGPRATIVFDDLGNASLTVDAGAVAGYLPLWLKDFARVVAKRTNQNATVTADLVYSEQPPVAASKDEWIVALSEALESSNG